MSTRVFAIGLGLAAVAGFLFASVSTLDFVQHLDRQVHDLHCSFAPGLVESDAESTGCQVTLLSPYSSVMRTALWGGIPISLPAMAIFAFLLFRSVELWLAPVANRRTSALVTFVATLIPVMASMVMGYLALTELHAVCKLCIGIYGSSGLAWLMAGLGWHAARRAEVEHELGSGHAPGSATGAAAAWLGAAGQVFGFVSVPVVAYAVLVPDYSRYIGTCGALIEPEDPYSVMVPLGPPGAGIPAIEVFDPLCPACRGFEERLRASGLGARLQRRALMFPLDSECNWMVTRSLHPGACRVSEAVLCASGIPEVGAEAVVNWAFDEQEALTQAGAHQPDSVTSMIVQRFPALSPCVGSAEVKSRLNQSLRWTVTNKLPVMTPQLYVAGIKLCDEDSDLGMDFILHRMLERHAAGTLSADGTKPGEATPSLIPGSQAPPAPPRSAGSRPATRAPAAAKPAIVSPNRTPTPNAEIPADNNAVEGPSPLPSDSARPNDATPKADRLPAGLPSVEQLPPPAADEPNPPQEAP